MPEIKKAMISSTARDLPLHREQVKSACQRVGVFPEQMMENLTAEDANAVEVSLRLVDEADVYIGIFAHRYGFVPDYDNPGGISITEMEYRWFFGQDQQDLQDKGGRAGPSILKHVLQIEHDGFLSRPSS